MTCSPCSFWIRERYSIPKELYTKHHQKKMGSKSVETSVRTLEPQSQSPGAEGSETLDESLPCGQPRLESTVVGTGPHRGGSILYDTTVVEPPYTQSSPSVADQTVLANPQQFLENFRTLRSDLAQGGQGNTGTGGGSGAQKCRYFLKGTCRHGFSGKVERDGKPGCLFFHPPVCKKYMDQGLKGCNKGSSCELTHVTICKESL